MSPNNRKAKTAPHKVLVANRGEVAARICRGVFECGWQSVALVEQGAPEAGHAVRADEVYVLDGTGAAAFLDADALVAAARATGCTMVHPGYGFLSEDPEFARKCAEAGLIFVGPSPETLSLFGDKSSARSVASECNVRTPPGSGILNDVADLRTFMERIDRPVMLKAVSGGGGRGIRIIRDVTAAEDSFARCRSEAEKAFGDGRLYAEALIEAARHVEIQIAGDGSREIAVLGDRECSLQRARQKIIEFAPAAGISDAQREELFDAARRIGAHVAYCGIGTVEFLVTAQEVFFLEVNPRLQVEHTVTEAVSGLDLVALQFRLALGARLAEEALPDAAAPQGCAVQLRLNAEVMGTDGSARPASGRITAFQMPMGPGLRVDTAGGPGQMVTTDFDSLLAKVVIHRADGDRAALLRRAYRALCETRIDGVETNIDFLRSLVSDDAVIADSVDVGFVDRNAARLLGDAPHVLVLILCHITD